MNKLAAIAVVLLAGVGTAAFLMARSQPAISGSADLQREGPGMSRADLSITAGADGLAVERPTCQAEADRPPLPGYTVFHSLLEARRNGNYNSL
jgi:hypothetical protein